MKLKPFREEDLNLPDHDLTVRLLAWWIGNLAIDAGIEGRVPPILAEQWRVAALELSLEDHVSAADFAHNAALEKALRLAARGDDRAAPIFRALVKSQSQQSAALDEAVTGRRILTAHRQAGGRKAGAARKRAAEPLHDRIRARATELLANGRAQHELAGILAGQFNKTARQIRTVLKAGPGPAKKKRKRA